MSQSDSTSREAAHQRTKPSFLWLAWRFLTIGTYGFGGGFAIIAVMEREFVTRYRSLSPQEFLHGVSLGQFLGSFAVNTAFFIGHRLRGVWGGLLATISFLAPSVMAVILLAWLTHSAKDLPTIQNGLAGIAPVVVALMVSAATSLAQSALHHRWTWGLAALGLAGTLMRISLPLLLFMGALLGYVLGLSARRSKAAHPSDRSAENPLSGQGSNHPPNCAAIPITVAAQASSTVITGKAALAAGTSLGLVGVAWLFLRIGLIFVGGGYVLVPLLQHELVTTRHLLSPQEFLEGLAISQLTPGPIAVLATYAGFRLAGAWGAIVATAALYTPATLLMAILCRAYEKLRRLDKVRDALAGTAAVVVGMIFGSALQLAPHSAVTYAHPWGIATAGAAYLLLRKRLHPAIVLFAGFMLGILMPNAFA